MKKLLYLLLTLIFTLPLMQCKSYVALSPFEYPPAPLSSMDTIYLNNPSFEDHPQCCKAPVAWYNCGPKEESPADVQPGIFDNNLPAFEGDTYVGMVTRDNETVEAISQHLALELKAGETYTFSFQAARAELYLSTSRTTGESANYNTPIRLLLYGGHDFCEKSELLAFSPLIEAESWTKQEFTFTPKENFQYFSIGADYQPLLQPYSGNVLIDACSPIIRISDKK